MINKPRKIKNIAAEAFPQQFAKLRATPKPRRAMRRRSKSLTKRMKVYNVLKEEFLIKHPTCAVFYGEKATTVHHQRGKIKTKDGDLLLETRWFIPCSLRGHIWVENHKDAARQIAWNHLPLVCAVGEFNTWKD